jgi:hypothetical protein
MVAVEERTRRRATAPLREPPPPRPEADSEPPLVRTFVLGLSLIAFLIAFEIALDFVVAYLVTGRAY